MSDDLTERARALIAESRQAEQRTNAPRRRTARKRKQYAKIEDLATHPEVNLTLQQLAVYWNFEVQTLRKWIRSGSLVGFHVGRSPRVRRVDAVAFERKNHLQKAG